MASMNNIRDALDALGALGDVDNASIPPGDNQTHDLPSHVSVELMNLQSLIEKGSSQTPAAIETLFLSFWDQYGKNLLLPLRPAHRHFIHAILSDGPSETALKSRPRLDRAKVCRNWNMSPAALDKALPGTPTTQNWNEALASLSLRTGRDEGVGLITDIANKRRGDTAASSPVWVLDDVKQARERAAPRQSDDQSSQVSLSPPVGTNLATDPPATIGGRSFARPGSPKKINSDGTLPLSLSRNSFDNTTLSCAWQPATLSTPDATRDRASSHDFDLLTPAKADSQGAGGEDDKPRDRPSRHVQGIDVAKKQNTSDFARRRSQLSFTTNHAESTLEDFLNTGTENERVGNESPKAWFSDIYIDSLFRLITLASSANSVAHIDPLISSRCHNAPHNVIQLTCGESAVTVLLPINIDDAHWVLAEVAIAQQSISIYDSLPSASSFDKIKEYMTRFINDAGAANWSTFAVRQKQCPRQTDNYDCGVCVVILAMHIVTGSLFLKRKMAIWRKVLHVLSSSATTNVHPEGYLPQLLPDSTGTVGREQQVKETYLQRMHRLEEEMRATKAEMQKRAGVLQKNIVDGEHIVRVLSALGRLTSHTVSELENLEMDIEQRTKMLADAEALRLASPTIVESIATDVEGLETKYRSMTEVLGRSWRARLTVVKAQQLTARIKAIVSDVEGELGAQKRELDDICQATLE
ncbi:LOW QUALITY PROTEIN: hemolysin-type calcium-binding region protein [Colletotrichum tofieldiae]|nr:LOW QUALITY PROTEIN: hemolysin-type calcium-binding region protein [Colletotrichum tofieldiae]